MPKAIPRTGFLTRKISILHMEMVGDGVSVFLFINESANILPNLLYKTLCPAPNSYVEALIPNVVAFKDGAFGNLLGLGEFMRVGPWSIELVSLKKRDTKLTTTLSLSAHLGKTMWAHNEKLAICIPMGELSPDTSPAGTLILDF